MRSGVLALVAVLAVGLVALVALGLTRGSSTVYTLGVAPQGPVAQLKPGSRACQGPIDLPDGAKYDRIGVYPRGGAVDVTVRPAAGGATFARGALEGANGAGTPPPLRTADVGRHGRAGAITVCFKNAGRRKLELWGTGSVASPSTSATVDGKPQDFDMGVTFERAGERSLIALLPDIAERASVFHPQWTSPAAYLVLALLVLLGGPALLVLALRRAVDD